MAEKSVNEVLADNLRYWMSEAGLKQEGLAERSGVSQRTISNYLNPGRRQESASGKEPSAKLTELSSISDALGVGIWDLVRPMTPNERTFYQQVEQAYSNLMHATVKPDDGREVEGAGNGNGNGNEPAAPTRKQRKRNK